MPAESAGLIGNCTHCPYHRSGGLQRALQDIHTAYHLVHMMSGFKNFEQEDRQAALNFAEAAKKAGTRRLIG